MYLETLPEDGKGAIAAGVAAGLMISFGQALSVPLLSSTVADFARRSADLIIVY